MDAVSFVSQRRSVRHFTKDPVPPETIDLLLRAASNAAPSAVNQQAYRFYVVTSRPLIQDLAARILQSLVASGFDVSAFKQFTEATSDDVVFYDAPSVIFITVPREGAKSPAYVAFDAGVAAQTIMLTAHLLGLGTCPVSCTSFADGYVLERLHAGPGEELCVAIAIGWPAPTAHPVDFSRKKTPAELALWLVE